MESKSGLFIVSYKIASPNLGAPTFEVHFAVNTPAKTVSGKGLVHNGTVNPPFNLHTDLRGDYTYMTVMPNNTHILVVAEGYPNIKFPPHAGIGPVILPNTKLRMVLESNWQSGKANFSYTDDKGNWQDVVDANVTMIKVGELAASN